MTAAKKTTVPRQRTPGAAAGTTALPLTKRCAQAVAALKAQASEATRAGMTRYAIPNDKAFGVSMRDVQAIAKPLRGDHELAEALWQTGLYDARMLACYIADPAQVTPAQMDRWARDFDNWAHCDTACFALWDRTPHAWKKIEQWATRKEEFVRRAAFALLASVSLHDKQGGDADYLHGLQLIEAAATDDRNFVKKGVNWALRAIGKRNVALRAAAIAVAQRLAAAEAAAPRWIGKDALRELKKAPKVRTAAADTASTKKTADAKKKRG
jgi:3-methyladenine DNA glycosylase AlkD